MTNKKYLIIAVLATFCLTATLFMIVPTRSQSSSYDPWTDINSDGTIDMADISMAIDGFMSSGDATKPVNVTNWPTSQPVNITGHATKLIIAAKDVIVNASSSWFSPIIPVDGYSKVTINIYMTGNTNGFDFFSCDGPDLPISIFRVEFTNFNWYFVKTYDVPGPYIYFRLDNQVAYAADIRVTVYLVA